MSVVSAFWNISKLAAIVLCFCVANWGAATAETQQAAKNARSTQPIVNGWEPVKKSKPVSHGWTTVSKSAVLLKKLDQLTDEDYAAALQAVHHALNELEDGRIYRWKRNDNKLHGKVMPTNVFRDKEGRVCRHLIYTLSLERYQKTVEGIACRTLNGAWSLSG